MLLNVVQSIDVWQSAEYSTHNVQLSIILLSGAVMSVILLSVIIPFAALMNVVLLCSVLLTVL